MAARAGVPLTDPATRLRFARMEVCARLIAMSGLPATSDPQLDTLPKLHNLVTPITGR
jgi:hypothetical protein